MIAVLISQMVSDFLRQTNGGIADGVHHSHQPNYSEKIELTRQYLLEILAMSGLRGVLVKKLFALSTRNSNYIPPHMKHMLMMRIMSSYNFPINFSFKPSSLGLVSLRTRVFKYDHFYKALIIGNESGNIFIIFDDGRRITHKMPNCITDVHMYSIDLVVVCATENHAHVMRIENGGLIPFCKLGHENDVNYACGNLSCNFFVSGSRDKSVKVWRIDSQGRLECLQRLDHNAKVNKVLIHGDSSAPVIAFSDCDCRIHLILVSKDGKKLLSRASLWVQDEGDLRIAFHPNPKKKILFSGGMNGLIIAQRFEITPSNEILTENFIIKLPNLNGYWTSSISFHHTFPIVLFCFADSNCEKLPNLTIAVVFSKDFKEVLFTNKLREGKPDGGSVRAVFSDEEKVLCSDYNIPSVLEEII